VGSAIPIATSPAGEYECAVAYAPSVNRFLVTWRHDPADNASADDQRIEGRVVNADGTFYTAAFTVADKTGQDFGPSIAFDGTQWFVAYTNVVSPADSNVCGRFVSGAGVPGTAVDIDAATDYAALPSVSFANGVYLAAWEKGTTTSRGVSCRKMTAAGAFPAAIAAVEPSANTPSEPDVSGGTTRFIVAWRRTSNNDVNARLVTADAATATAFPVATFNLRTGATARETPRAAFATTPGQWYVAFADAATTSTDVYGVRVTTAGAPSPVDQLTNTSSKEWRPELAYNAAANEALVVYLKNAAAPYQVLCRRWSFGNGPQAPASLTATPGVGQISLSWSAVAGAASYTVKRATTWGGPYAVIASNVVAFGYVDAGLGNNQTRYYVVSSVGSAGEGPETAPVSAKTLGVPPAPGSLTATAESTTSIRLSWPDVAGEERYEVLDGQNVVVATLPADTTSWTETNLVENTPYPRKVRGVNGVGTGGTTALVTRYTLVRQASGQHATIVANAEAVDIQAAKPPNFDKGQTGCRMIKYDAGTSTWVTLKDFDVQYMGRDTPVGSGGTKYYAFVYRNGDGIWNPSYSETFTIAVPWSSSPPPAPKNLAAAAASGSATLTWDPTPGAYYFTLKRATSPSGPWTVVAQDLIPSFYQNTYVNSGLTNLTTYYYVVTARNYGGESGPSNQASVTPGAPTVTVEVPDGSASEAGDAGQFLIRRTGDTSFSLQVFFTVSGTASSGADYTALSTSVTLAAGV
ncbi:MAG TPA: hypothetical protein VEJ18_12895, partial [Planctomycetota bacterium]|nr:hypothetical protein [Planctomycetota bacterium]